MLLKITLIVFIVVIVLGGGYFFFQKKVPKVVNNDVVFTVSNGVTSEEDVQKESDLKVLSEDEYRKVDRELTDLVDNENPRAALFQLAALMKSDSRVLKECHGFVHDIGHAAFNKYKDFTKIVSFQDDLCGSGYIHGAVEIFFASSKDVYGDMQKICSTYDPRVAGTCYHGVGHGLMYYTDNTLPVSILYCANYKTNESRSRCAEGVYMENFGTLRSLHPSIYLHPDDPLYPCSEQPEEFKGACYYYAPLYYLNLHDEDYVGGFDMCRGAEGGYKKVCIKGLGSRVIKQHIEDVPFAESVCAKNLKDEEFNACLDGIISFYLVNYDSVSKGKEMCGSLEESHQEYCLGSVERQKSLATKP